MSSTIAITLRPTAALLMCLSFFGAFLADTARAAAGAPKRVNGRMAASKQPGLGIQPKMDVLGKSVLEIR